MHPSLHIRGLSELDDIALLRAVELFWQAFARKLGPVLGQGPDVVRRLAGVARPDHALVAVDDTGVVRGVIGFCSPGSSFVPLSRADLQEWHGRLSGWLRWRMLLAHGQDSDLGRFVIDGLAVDRDWRGCGTGTALLAAAGRLGLARGHDLMRLDVAVENARAHALYLRLGFRQTGLMSTGIWAPVLGTRGSRIMQRDLHDPWPPLGQSTVLRSASAP